MEVIFGVIGIVVSALFVLGIAWHEGVALRWIVFVVFSIAATIFVMKFMRNLEEWQLGLFAFLFGLAIVGGAYLLDASSRSKE